MPLLLTTQRQRHPLKCLFEEERIKRSCLADRTIFCNAERQAGKLWIPTF